MTELTSETFGFHVSTTDEGGLRPFPGSDGLTFDDIPSTVSLFAIGNLSKTYVISNGSTVKLGRLSSLNSGDVSESIAEFSTEGKVYQLCYNHNESKIYMLSTTGIQYLDIDTGKLNPLTTTSDSKQVCACPYKDEVAYISGTQLFVGSSPLTVCEQYCWGNNGIYTATNNIIKLISEQDGKEIKGFTLPEIDEVSNPSTDLHVVNMFFFTSQLFVSCSFEDDGDVSYKCFTLDLSSETFAEVDIAVPFAEVDRQNYYYHQPLINWIDNNKSLHFVTAGFSTDIGTLLLEGDNVNIVMPADDALTPSFPLADDGLDLSPVGMGIDLSNSSVKAEGLCDALEEATGLPKIWVFTNDFTLLSWWVFDVAAVKSNKASLERAMKALQSNETKPPETEQSDTKPSETKPSENKSSENKPSEVEPSETKPAFGSFGNVGKPTGGFGSSGFGSSGFGSSKPISSSDVGSSGSKLTASFGSTGFGSTGFGSTGFASSGFGSNSAFASSGFGSSSKPASSGGSGFASFSNKSGFGSTKKDNVFGSKKDDVFGTGESDNSEYKSPFGSANNSNNKPFSSNTSGNIFDSTDSKPFDSSASHKESEKSESIEQNTPAKPANNSHNLFDKTSLLPGLGGLSLGSKSSSTAKLGEPQENKPKDDPFGSFSQSVDRFRQSDTNDTSPFAKFNQPKESSPFAKFNQTPEPQDISINKVPSANFTEVSPESTSSHLDEDDERNYSEENGSEPYGQYGSDDEYESYSATPESEEAEDKALDEAEFCYFDGFTKPLAKYNNPIQSKLNQLVNEIHGHLTVYKQNQKKFERFFNQNQTVDGLTLEKVFKEPETVRLEMVQQLRQDIQKKSSVVTQQKTTMEGFMTDIKQIEKLGEENQILKYQIDKSITNLQLYHKDATGDLAKYKHYPLDYKNQLLQKSLRHKVHHVQKLKDELLRLMIPIKAQLNVDEAATDHLKQVLFNINEFIYDKKQEILTILEKLETIDKSVQKNTNLLIPTNDTTLNAATPLTTSERLSRRFKASQSLHNCSAKFPHMNKLHAS